MTRPVLHTDQTWLVRAIRSFSVVLTISISFSGFAGNPIIEKDSVKGVKSKVAQFKVMTSVQSMGYFSYGGQLVSNNPSADFYIGYRKSPWGATFYKAIDLFDHTSPNNFALLALDRNFSIGSRLSIRPQIAFVLEQLESFADHGSDFSALVNAKFLLSKEFTIEYMGLLSNALLHWESMDWVNRVKIAYSKSNYSFTWLGWHNNGLFDQEGYYSTGLSAFYNNIKLSKGISMNNGITTHTMIYSSNEKKSPLKNGIVLSAYFVLDRSN